MDTPTNTGDGSVGKVPPKPADNRKSLLIRWAKRLSIALVILLIATLSFGRMVVSHIIDWQLKSQLASRVNARLETASVKYLFPYGVRIEKAHLVVPDTAEGRGWGIDVNRLELTLAKLPLGTGPLVIQSLDIDQPVVRLSAADSTDSTATNPLSQSTPTGTAQQPPAASAASTAQKKLSDLFQLRRVTVNDARVEFDPGTVKQHKSPVVWEHLHANMLTTPVAGGDYQFTFQAKDEPLAVIDAAGAFDIDSLLLDMQKLSVTVQVNPAAQAQQLPPAVQEMFRKFKVGGEVKFDAAAKVRLDDPMHGIYAATLSLANGTGEVPGLDKPLSPAQFVMKCSNAPNITRAAFGTPLPGDLPKSSQPLHLWVAGLKICSDKKLAQIDDGEFRFDPLTGIWSINQLKGIIDAGRGPRPIMSLNANGALDLNTMVLDLQRFSLALQCGLKPAAPGAALTQQDAPTLNVGGQMLVDAIAKVPLRAPARSLFSTHVSLANGIATVPGLDGPVSPAECAMVCSNLESADEQSLPTTIKTDFPGKFAPVRLWVHKLNVGAVKRRVQIDQGELGFDMASGAWSVRDLKGQVDVGSGLKPITQLTANGGIDLNTDVLDVQKLSLNVDETTVSTTLLMTTPVKESPSTTTHPAAGPTTKPLKFSGQLTLDMIARMPLKEPMRGLFSARLSLRDGIAEVPGIDGPISPVDCVAVCSNLPGITEKAIPARITIDLPKKPIPLHMWLDTVKAVNGNQLVDLEGGEGSFDPETLNWTLEHLRGEIDAGNGPGAVADANILMRVPFTLAGSGKMLLDGSPIPLDEKSHLDLKLDRALMDVTENRIPFRNIDGLVQIFPHEMVTKGITGTSMGGKFNSSLDTTWRKVGTAQKMIPTYNGSIDIYDLDLHRVSMVFTNDLSLQAQTSGVMNFSLKYRGLIVPGADPKGPQAPVNLVSGSGDFDIQKGNFKTIPMLKDIAAAVGVYDAATIGQAAGIFTFTKQLITFQKAAASAPAIGVTGTGTVTFDQVADMTFVVDPGADWANDVNSWGNPALNGVANLLHKAQEQFHKAQASILQEKITGPVTDPKITPVGFNGGADKVGAGAVDMFHKMSQGINDGSLLQKIKGN